MKKILLFTFIFLLLFGASVTSNADPIDDPLKWTQPPDLDYGSSITSLTNTSTILVADDWQCRNGFHPVTDIHWWGSYSDCGSHSGQIDSFFIAMFLDVPDDIQNPLDGGHPGGFAQNWAYYFSIDRVNETPYADNIFQYYIPLNENEHFNQDEGEIYWIAIAAVLNEGATQTWGWSTTSPDNNWRNDASLTDNFVDWEELYYPNDYPYELYRGQSINMAFELSTIPEPGTIILLGSLATGLFGMAGLRRRFTKH